MHSQSNCRMANQTETDRNRGRKPAEQCMRWMHDDAEINCNLLAFSLNNKFHLSFCSFPFRIVVAVVWRGPGARRLGFLSLTSQSIYKFNSIMRKLWPKHERSAQHSNSYGYGRTASTDNGPHLMKEKEAIEGMKLNHWMAASNITGAHILIHDQIIISIRFRWTRSKTFLCAHWKWMHLVHKPYS